MESMKSSPNLLAPEKVVKSNELKCIETLLSYQDTSNCEADCRQSPYVALSLLEACPKRLLLPFIITN